MMPLLQRTTIWDSSKNTTPSPNASSKPTRAASGPSAAGCCDGLTLVLAATVSVIENYPFPSTVESFASPSKENHGARAPSSLRPPQLGGPEEQSTLPGEAKEVRIVTATVV